MTLASLDVHYRAPVCVDDVVSVAVFVDGSDSTSVLIHCEAWIDDGPTAAACRSRYVYVDLAGTPTPWPARIGACLASLTRAVPRN
jgi:acyl-CoA thioesterase FadM